MDPVTAAGGGRSPNLWTTKECPPTSGMSEQGAFFIRRTYKKSSKFKEESNKFEVEVPVGSPRIDAQEKGHRVYRFQGPENSLYSRYGDLCQTTKGSHWLK